MTLENIVCALRKVHDAAATRQVARCRHRAMLHQHGTILLTVCTVIHVLSSAALSFPRSPTQYAAQSTPSFEEFQSLWTAWDIVTKAMVPREELLSKPIKLRNALIFYLGHIPTFLGQYSTCLSQLPCNGNMLTVQQMFI